MPLPPNPHDALFKTAFGRPDIARSELEVALPSAVRAHLDLSTLEVQHGSFLDDALQATHADLLYAVRTTDGREAFVFILFEHQSSFDAEMPWRLLRYMVRVWDRYKREHPASLTLPIVVPVVLHHGPSGWRAEPEFATMFDASPELLEAVRPFQPQFRFVLDDLAVVSLDDLRSRALHALTRLVLLGLWSARSFPRLHEAAPVMAALIATLGHSERTRTLLTQLYLYLLRAGQPDVELDAVRTILLQVAGPEGQEDIVNAVEQLIEEGRIEGMRVAISSLISALVNVGEQLVEKGRAEGVHEGRVEGLAEGEARALLGVASARGIAVSDAMRKRILACSDLAQLDAWLLRALTATSAVDVVGE